jgi:hypothetical protein
MSAAHASTVAAAETKLLGSRFRGPCPRSTPRSVGRPLQASSVRRAAAKPLESGKTNSSGRDPPRSGSPGWSPRAAGTSVFALAHLAWFAVWIVANAGLVRGLEPVR